MFRCSAAGDPFLFQHRTPIERSPAAFVKRAKFPIDASQLGRYAAVR
jgi:hypothetical protein